MVAHAFTKSLPPPAFVVHRKLCYDMYLYPCSLNSLFNCRTYISTTVIPGFWLVETYHAYKYIQLQNILYLVIFLGLLNVENSTLCIGESDKA